MEEEGKYYPILFAKAQGKDTLSAERIELSQTTERAQATTEEIYGPVLLQKKHPVLLQFLQKEERELTKIMAQVAKAGAAQRTEEITERLAKNRKAQEKVQEK